MNHASSPTTDRNAADLGSQREGDGPVFTLFTVPKPFDGRADLIQHNAIGSWTQLHPSVDVLLVGDEAGISEAAQRWGVRHVSGLQYNASGTPLVNSAFELARQHCRTDWLVYCNSDVILLDEFPRVLRRLVEEMQGQACLGFGRRTDLKVTDALDLSSAAERTSLLEQAQASGAIASQVCKEYFVFPTGLYREMPPFAIGRGNWDNWMVRHAKSQRLPVVNLSDVLTVIHQEHDYGHLESNRYQCYVAGPEAKQNESLAGGKFLVRGSTGTHRLTDQGIRPEPPLLLNREFWADVPRFLRLATQLLSRQS